MKKTLLSLFIALAALSTEAQTFNFSTEQHITSVVGEASYQAYEVRFATQEPEDITFKWKRISNTVPEKWTYSLCDYGGCYVGLPSGGQMSFLSKSAMENGEEGFLIFNVNLKEYGEGEVRIYVYDSKDINRGDTISIHITYRNFVSLPELSAADFKVYPNPASEKIKIEFPAGSNYTATLYNQIGEAVLAPKVGLSENSEFDLTGLNKGVYYLRLISEEGNLITKKVIIA